MPRSMTGYGRGECLLFNRKAIVEIKSVNHRYNDISIRMPRILNPYEDVLRKKLAAAISRGKTDVYVSLESFAENDVKIKVNETLAAAYIKELIKLEERFSGQLPSAFTLDKVASFPDVITIDKSMDDGERQNQTWECVEQAADQAIARFTDMREKEGGVITRDIKSKLAETRELFEKVRQRAPFVAQEYQARITEKMSELLRGAVPDENRLLMEAALFAERSCIDEEMTRFESHLTQMDGFLSQNGAIGRKLDFLAQEMNREINTIGSKSNDLDITHVVVDLKGEVEKIREQVQNIE